MAHNLSTNIFGTSRVLIVSLISLQTPMSAQPSWYFNFGCKLGYAAGIYGEFIGGIELSVTRWPENSRPATGVCLSVEQSSSFLITHFGFEIIGGGVGGSLGPSIVISEGQRDVALAATAWGGVIVLPYLRETWRTGQSSIREFGAFIKIPKQIYGPQIRFGE